MDKDNRKLSFLIYKLITSVIWVGLTALCIYATLHGDKFMYSRDETVYFTFYLFPFLLIGALYGYFISMFTFVIAFVHAIFFSTTTAYYMSIYLVATLCFSLFSQYGFFGTKKKTIIASCSTLIMTALAEYACLTVLMTNQYNLDNINQFLWFILRDTGSAFCTSILLYILFAKLPDTIKIIFPLGLGYTELYKQSQELQNSIKKTRLSVKITSIIIAVELILGLSVAVFMMVLFPDLKNMFIGGIERRRPPTESTADAPKDEDYLGQIDEEGAWDYQAAEEGREDTSNDSDSNEISPENSSEEASLTTETLETSTDTTTETQKMVDEIQNLKFKFDDVALGFDIKMILLMLCVGVPMACFANFFTKMTIGAPIGSMSDFLFEYANADDDKKLEVGHKVDRILVGSRDEIKVLHESMKTTVHSVEDYIGRLQEEQELEKELEIAQKASEAKSSFLSNMSHEIRTPINAVLGMNEMILRESDNDQILEYANNVKSAGNSLLGIINDILDFSKIEAGKMDILPVQYHLGSTINDLINMVSVKAEDKGLKLELDIDKTLPTQLIGDEIRIKQCATNVLTNAVKYTEQGTVTLSVTYEKIDDINIMLRFRVVDTGIGIKEEDLNKLYSPFERIEEIRNRSVEGTGLGMSIVKKLLALMDSRLEVKSVYGEGSDFSFAVKQQVVSWEELGDFKKKYKEYLRTLHRYHEAFRAPECEILVVDDTPINLTVVKGLLKKTLIRIDTAESGFEAIDKVKQKRYDAIFIDHRMPEMDGIQTLEAMKKMDDNQSAGAPCIALTANAGESARENYLAAGFDDYLSKPVDGEVMEEMLKGLLPSDKVILAGDAGYDELLNDSVLSDQNAGATSGKGGADTDEREKLYRSIEGIDYEEAIKNCGSLDILQNVIEEFSVSIDTKADDIERFAGQEDYRNFTVAVHALKSSARLLGAMELSGQAAYLEQCGNDENDSEISTKTPELLELYRSYKDKLSKAVPKTDSEALPEIPADELDSAFSDMKELIEAFDFDTADGIMKMLSEYKIPDSRSEKYSKVVELMAAVDRDALIELL